MKIDEHYLKRYQELLQASYEFQSRYSEQHDGHVLENEAWIKWATNALNLIKLVFDTDSVHFTNFKDIYDKAAGYKGDLDLMRAVFSAAMEDYQKGYFVSLSNAISHELFGDFVQLAERCLVEGNKDAAAVVACAALEDALKRYASSKGIDIQDKSMQDVVNTLKSKGLVSGAQKSLLDVMPKIRDYAMHANWDKIASKDVSGVIGFVKGFLSDHF